MCSHDFGILHMPVYPPKDSFDTSFFMGSLSGTAFMAGISESCAWKPQKP